MRKIFCMFVVLLFLVSCETYTKETITEFKKMKKPVVIHFKFENSKIVLKDNLNNLYTYGNKSTFASWLMENYETGNTINFFK
jgi:hypothetical protein